MRGSGQKGKIVGAVATSAGILRHLRASRNPLTATQIARDLKINPSTCFNILRTLVDEDFVRHEPSNKTYSLSLGLMALVRGALEQNDALRILEPQLRELARKHGLLAALLRRVNNERSIMVAAASSDSIIHLQARIGSTSPLLLGAAGRVFAAYAEMDDDMLREGFEKLRLARPLDFATFRRQVDDVLDTGWALDDGNFLAGTVSVAAPVFDPLGDVHLCVSAIMLNIQHDARVVTSIAAELVAIGNSLRTVSASF